jgi:hypothetical protein
VVQLGLQAHQLLTTAPGFGRQMNLNFPGFPQPSFVFMCNTRDRGRYGLQRRPGGGNAMLLDSSAPSSPGDICYHATTLLQRSFSLAIQRTTSRRMQQGWRRPNGSRASRTWSFSETPLSIATI